MRSILIIGNGQPDIPAAIKCNHAYKNEVILINAGMFLAPLFNNIKYVAWQDIQFEEFFNELYDEQILKYPWMEKYQSLNFKHTSKFIKQGKENTGLQVIREEAPNYERVFITGFGEKQEKSIFQEYKHNNAANMLEEFFVFKWPKNITWL